MVKYRNVRHRWVEVTEEKALEIAKKLWKMADDDTVLKAINNRFEGIRFTREELDGKPKKEII